MATTVCINEPLALDSNIAERARALREGGAMPELSARFTDNVEPLSVAEAAEIFRELDRRPARRVQVNSGAEINVWIWPANDPRWEMTPHALRRLEQKRGPYSRQ